MLSEEVLRVDQLTKKYKDFQAVDGISFSLKRGEVLGLLGPNGAGKTTTIQMLLGLTVPTSGSISYFGLDFEREREACLARINFASAYAQMNSHMTVWQNLRIFAGFYNVVDHSKRIGELTDLLDLGSLLQKQFWHLSSGQQTKVILAKSLLNKPELLLMDEPTASLDPDVVDQIIKLVLNLKQTENTAFLFTSHNMEEVTRVCDRVMFLQHGKIVVEDTPLELTRLAGDARLILAFDGDPKTIEASLAKKKLHPKFLRSDLVEIECLENEIPGVLFDLKQAGLWITNIEIKMPTLEDVFLSFSRQAKLSKRKVS